MGWEEWRMQSYHCCGEFVTTAVAIRRTDRRIWKALVDLMWRTATIDWGHITEWLYQNLFTKETRPAEEVVPKLEKLVKKDFGPPFKRPPVNLSHPELCNG